MASFLRRNPAMGSYSKFWLALIILLPGGFLAAPMVLLWQRRHQLRLRLQPRPKLLSYRPVRVSRAPAPTALERDSVS